MPELLERIREFLAPAREERPARPVTDDAEHDRAERRLKNIEGELRMARIDAGLPVDRRFHSTAGHPSRRSTDGH